MTTLPGLEMRRHQPCISAPHTEASILVGTEAPAEHWVNPTETIPATLEATHESSLFPMQVQVLLCFVITSAKVLSIKRLIICPTCCTTPLSVVHFMACLVMPLCPMKSATARIHH